MKATIDIPADLYRQVKAKSALEGRAIREVTAELYEAYLRDAAAAGGREPVEPTPEVRERPLPAWFGVARRLGAEPADPDMVAIRASVERGWTEETAASERRLRRPSRR